MENDQQVPQVPEVQEAPAPTRSPQRSPSSSSASPPNSPRSKQGSRSRSAGRQSPDAPRQDGKFDEEEGRAVRYKYCCRVCKHTDKSKKACVCVVPLSQRRSQLGENGCRNCGCKGCSREDYIRKGEDPVYYPSDTKKTPQIPPPAPPRKEERQSRRRSRSRSSDSPEYIDSYKMRFYNFDQSVLGSMISNEFHVNPALMGFAIPQRSYSYIFGKPR